MVLKGTLMVRASRRLSASWPRAALAQITPRVKVRAAFAPFSRSLSHQGRGFGLEEAAAGEAPRGAPVQTIISLVAVSRTSG